MTGVSTRSAADSAARAGFTVTALDAFADRDQHPAVRALSLPRDFGARFTPPAAARAAKGIESDAVAYLSSFENHPNAIATLSAGRVLLGNPPSAIARVRDPREVARAWSRRGLAAPLVRQAPAARGQWLVKPVASGGGRRVRRWRAGAAVPRGSYLQQFVEGTPGSVVFVAASGRAVPLGVTRQIVGDAAFGARGFQYCGSLLAPAGDAQFSSGAALFRRARVLAGAAAAEFGLVGVNGVDFIAREGEPLAIEVNPRWCASMELVESAHGFSVFDAHARACVSGDLPDVDLLDRRPGVAAVGKAIVFARRDVTVGGTDAWIAAGIRDVPTSGESIHAGQPVCTVLAAGRDAEACYDALVRRAAAVYSDLAGWERRVA